MSPFGSRRLVPLAVIPLVAAALSPLMGQAASAAPPSPTDGTKVPHYFGPWPNWANSKFTQGDAVITINGNGTGAQGIAHVDDNGGVSWIEVTDPGQGYTKGTATITGSGTGATATVRLNTVGTVTDAVVDAGGGGYRAFTVSLSGGGGSGATVAATGTVDAVTLSAGGGGYTNPSVQLSGGGGQGATATVSGAVDALSLGAGGGGYTEPAVTLSGGGGQGAGATASGAVDAVTLTSGGAKHVHPVVTFSAPETAGGVTATGSVAEADLDPDTGAITKITLDEPGSGYTKAPTVTIADPDAEAANDPDYAAGAASTTLKVTGLHVTESGTGYTSAPVVAIADTGAGAGAGATATSALRLTSVTVTDGGSGYTGAPTVTVGDGDGGAGTGAAAAASLKLAALAVTAPGSAYTDDPTLTVTDPTGAGSGAQGRAIATVKGTGSVTRVEVAAAGAGYSAFDVAFAGGEGAGAAGTAWGGVHSIDVKNGGRGYTSPSVSFDLPDQDGGATAKGHVATLAADGVDGMDANGTITKVIIDFPGTGYTTPPGAAIINGTIFDPVPMTGTDPLEATITTDLELTEVRLTDFGSGYTSAPTVTVTDPVGSGTGATTTAVVHPGAIAGVTVTAHGQGYLDKGIKKFQDTLPLPCDPAVAPAAGGCPEGDANAKYLPIAVPNKRTYNGVEADEYVIGLVQYRTKVSTDVPATLVRGYVQLETSANAAVSEHFPLQNELMDGTKVDTGYFGVTRPQWLGPFIAATKNRPVRVVFRNLLPTGKDGDLFLPTDTSMMGSGMGPMGMADPVNDGTVSDEVRNPTCDTDKMMCFKDNRATLHLHGGVTPWISDGTPHQWITPAGENTSWPEGVSVRNVPDMADAGCDSATDGCQTFFYTNQQSARLMFYHDHSWGITRLNVYAGEAAGYQITDTTEERLVNAGTIPGAADTIPLIVQDRTFLPGDKQLYDVKDGNGNTVSYGQDPTWDKSRWGGEGSLWYHHVYMPAQNPGDPSGMSAYGRWMYGPWFYPPATGTKYGPIDNPYYDPTCNLDKPSTWQYQTDPFCEPKQIPGTPNVSAGMEQFNDTPLVNGVAYPKITLQPKSYRLRFLNAANDRFFNFQWYMADPNQGDGTTEVKLNPQELAAAQTDINVSPTPARAKDDTAGPDWVQIASEGGFLPAPAVIDGQQPTTWITDPTRFDVGNVDQHSLLVAPAERADTVVDFSKFAGKTLILYNDAPAAFPARVASYDYYTGAPDMSPNGAARVFPGYGPNTRTIMQVTIAPAAPAPAFNLTKLQTAFKHNASGTGVFESGQHPIIVGQAAYNSAYGSNFAASGNCNTTPTLQKCDGLVRIGDTTATSFNTLLQQSTRQSLKIEHKSIHDETNATTFDEFGRMQANLGVEKSPPTAGTQNAILYPYVNPPTELIDGTKLPTADMKITPISDLADGTQIWRITHNGVDTHPIHFHLFDVQLINRVTWDNIIIPNDPNENGWKDTVRVSPLEDTIVALRPITPKLPFEIPNSVRPLNPMMPLGSTAMFNPTDTAANPASVVNKLINFGWEYVYHCHILSHEEMDMMRPVSYALPPTKPDGLVVSVLPGRTPRLQVTFNDNSIAETGYVLQRSTNGTTWTNVGTSASPLDAANTKGPRTIVDTSSSATTAYLYRVVAQNTVGYGGAFPSITTSSTSNTIGANPPAAPSPVTASVTGSTSLQVQWRDNASNETGFTVQRSTDGGANWSTVFTRGSSSGTVNWTDRAVTVGTTYTYRVGATNAAGTTWSANATVTFAAPLAPVVGTATAARTSTTSERVTVAWQDLANNEISQTVQWSTTAGAPISGSANAAANATTWTSGTLTRRVWYVRVGAVNPLGTTWSSWVAVPAAP